MMRRRGWGLVAVAAVSALMGGAVAPAAAAVAQSPQWTFDTAGDTRGWSAGGTTAGLAATASGLEVSVAGNDPWIMSGMFALEASTANTVVIHAQNATANTGGKIYWETEAEPVFSESRSRTFPLRTEETAPGEYRVDLRGVDSWDGTIRRLRIDPGENASDPGVVTITSVGFAYNDEVLPEPEPPKPEREPVEHVGAVEPISASAEEIRVTGTAPAAETLTLYELDGWEYEPDFGDGIVLGSQDGGSEFSFTVPRFDGERDRIYSKFLVVADAEGEPRFIDSPRYVTQHDYAAENDFPFPAPPTKKGLQVQLTDDADELGVGHAAINIALDQALLAQDDGEDSIPFESDGETYYFDKACMQSLDRTIKPLSDNGMLVNTILIAYDDAQSNPGVGDLLIHPDAERRAPGAIVYAFNTADENSRYFRATMEFLADRYSREDEAYGRVVGWIVGNEVDSAWVWQNMGDQSLGRFVDDYDRAVRWVETAVKNEYAQARTYISLDHFWTMKYNTSEPGHYYSGRDLVDRMVALGRETGEYGWNIAYHPYPENLFNPATWNDKTALDSVETPRITFKNLHVLGQYLLRDEQLFQGEQRRVILSEQGFHAPGNDPENQDLQAAAYAYAYYRAVSTPGIDAFILHRHVDHKNEGGLRLGLWTWDDERPEPSSPGETRRIYDVFRFIDTPESRAHTEFALPVIGADSWESLFPGLDIEAQGTRPLPHPQPLDLREDAAVPDLSIAAGEWVAGENVTSVSATSKGAVTADFDALDKQWRGITYQPAEPVDASASPFLQVRLNVPGTTADAQRVAKVKVYSGAEVAEGTVTLSRKATNLTLDLSGWEQRDHIERVKVWLRGASNADWEGEFSVSDAGFTAHPGAVAGANLLLSASAPSLAAGEPVTIGVRNGGAAIDAGTVRALDSNGLTLAEDKLALPALAPLDEVSLTATIAEVGERDAVSVRFQGRDYVVAVVPDPPAPQQVDVLYGFESGLQGWQAGENTTSVATASGMANAPGTPREGAALLAAVTEALPADHWRTVFVEPDAPLALDGAGQLLVSLDAYGGMGSSYEARVALTTTVGEYEHVAAVQPDSWNDLQMPLADVRGDVTRIAVSFRAVGVTTPWNPQFQVDRVALATQ
ncbi:DUF5722 domain-containing protein [Microbacterium arborescens]